MKIYCLFSGILFAIVTIVHIFRFIEGWEVSVAGIFVPLWVSGIAIIVTGLLAIIGLSFGLRKTASSSLPSCDRWANLAALL